MKGIDQAKAAPPCDNRRDGVFFRSFPCPTSGKPGLFYRSCLRSWLSHQGARDVPHVGTPGDDTMSPRAGCRTGDSLSSARTKRVLWIGLTAESRLRDSGYGVLGDIKCLVQGGYVAPRMLSSLLLSQASRPGSRFRRRQQRWDCQSDPGSLGGEPLGKRA
jgi:hypothetical protein